MATKSPLRPETIKLLRRVERRILDEPKRYDQGIWFNTKDGVAPCGTAGCIGGWAQYLSKDNYNNPVQLAVDRRNSTLFTGFPESLWPEPFAAQWRETLRFSSKAVRRRHQARIAVARIEHFIATGH